MFFGPLIKYDLLTKTKLFGLFKIVYTNRYFYQLPRTDVQTSNSRVNSYHDYCVFIWKHYVKGVYCCFTTPFLFYN